MAIEDFPNSSRKDESNLKKLEEILRTAAQKVGKGIFTDSREEQILFSVMNEALAPEDLCVGKLRNSRYGISLIYDIKQYPEERVIKEVIKPFLESQDYKGNVKEIRYGFRIATTSVRAIDIACPQKEAEKFERFTSAKGIETSLLDRNTNSYLLKKLPE